MQGSRGGNLYQINNLEDLDVDGKGNFNMDFQEIRLDGVDWVEVVKNRDR
jgi:hypothetical protein